MSKYYYLDEICDAVEMLHQLYAAKERPVKVFKRSEYVEGIPAVSKKEPRKIRLEDTVKDKLEYIMNCKIPEVTIHIGGYLQEQLREAGAAAMTAGKNIYIREEEYVEGSEETDKLLVHELTHTVQMSGDRRLKEYEEIAEAETEAYEKEQLVVYESEPYYYARINGQMFYLNKSIEKRAIKYAIKELRKRIEKYIEEENIEMITKFCKFLEKRI